MIYNKNNRGNYKTKKAKTLIGVPTINGLELQL